jgi:hypothetical protein
VRANRLGANPPILCLFVSGFRRFLNGYAKVSEATFCKEKTVMDRKHEQSDRAGSARSAGRRPGGVARYVAGPGRADPEAAAELPTDDPADDGHLHAAPEHPGVVPI